MSDLPRKAQLTFVLVSGIQVQVLIAERGDILAKQLDTAKQNKTVAELTAIIGKDEEHRIEYDKLYIPGESLLFWSIIQPKAESLIHIPDVAGVRVLPRS